MKAVLIHRYGGTEVLKLNTLPMPEPKGAEVLVRNVVATVNPYDCMVRTGSMWFMEGFRFPKILGGESAGVIEKVGADVKQFKPGDRVIAFLGRSGGYAEYVAVSEKNIIALPDGVSFAEGAALPIAGCTAHDAWHGVGKILPGMNVLVNGAYGSVGSYAVQLAKLAGARVTGVCSTPSLNKVEQLGADEVIDYTKEDFRKNGKQYDLIFDTPSVLSFRSIKSSLNSSGMLMCTLPSLAIMASSLVSSWAAKKVKVVFAKPDSQKIELLIDHMQKGALRSILDREYPIEEIADAHRYSETKRAKGKIIVNF